MTNPDIRFPTDLSTKSTPIGADKVLIADSVTGELRNSNLSDLPVSNATASAIASAGNMTKAVYDPTNISEQLVGINANQSLTNKTVNGVDLNNTSGSTTFLAGDGQYRISTGIAGNPGETKAINDTTTPQAGTVVTYSNTQLWIQVTRSDNSYTLYLATGNTHPFSYASGIYEFDLNGALLSNITLAGTYSSITPSITYSDGSIIDGITGKYTFLAGNVAYLNKSNTFTEPNIFEGNTSFKALCLFPYFENTAGTTTFNATKGAKQKFSVPGGQTKALSFVGLRSGGNYTFAIVVTGAGDLTLTKATVFTACDTITQQYEVGDTTFPLTLPVGVHMFFCEAFGTAIHIAHTTSKGSA